VRATCIFCGNPDGACPCHDQCPRRGEVKAHCCCREPCELCGLLIVPMLDEQPCKGRCCARGDDHQRQ
jgi:hypothetical protein